MLFFLPVLTVLALCQGKANSKIKTSEDKEEGDLTVSNGNHVNNDNSCGELSTDLDNKVEGSARMPEEDDVDGIATDEPRPRKKIKSAIDAGSCTGKAGNGRITSLSVGTLFLGCYVLLCICGPCD